MENKLKVRDSSLDVVRIAAVLSVLGIHFFLYTGFYVNPVEGPVFYLMCLIRTLTRCCVPLFMLLTGYLMAGKTYGKGYLKGIRHTLGIYLLASAACLIVRTAWGESLTFREMVLKILDYSADEYSWYVEMYIGLFLLAPFLNAGYGAMGSRKGKQTLLLIMLLLTAMPGMINILNLGQPGWVRTVLTDYGNAQIIPNYWTMLYPFTFYLIGVYLREFRPKIRSLWLAGLLAVHIVIYGSFCFTRSIHRPFLEGPWQYWGAMGNVITTVLVFLLITNLSTENWKPGIKTVLMHLANLSYGVYLMSWVTDQWLYPRAMMRVGSIQDLMPWYVPVVLLSFLGALILSWILEILYKGIFRLCTMLVPEKKETLTH